MEENYNLPTDPKEIIPLVLPASVGVAFATDMIKVNKLAEVSGVPRNVISSGIRHSIRNGYKTYYSELAVSRMQSALQEIGKQLLAVTVSLEPATEMEAPLCYGQNIVERMKVLKSTLNLPWVFEQYMGVNKNWVKRRLNDSRPQNLQYGKFSDDELANINKAIRTIALRLCSITLIEDERN